MASRQVLMDAQEGFAGGFDSNGARVPVAVNQFAGMQNVRLVTNGEMAKRPGFRVITDFLTNGFFQSDAYFWEKQSGSSLVAIDASGKLHLGTFDQTAGTIAWSAGVVARGGGQGQVASFRATTTADILYIADPAFTGLGRYDGAFTILNAFITTAPNAVWVYNQRLFASSGTKLFWSGVNNGDTIGDPANGGGSATISTFASSNIDGGMTVGNTNFIFHDLGISQFTGRTFDDIQIQAGTEGVTPDVRIVSPRACGVVDGVGYVITKSGLFFLSEANGALRYQQPNRPDPMLPVLRSAWTVNRGCVIDNARANEIWFGLTVQPTSGGSSDTYFFIYSKLLGVFTGQVYLPHSAAFPGGSIVTGFSGISSAAWPQIFFVAAAAGACGVYALDFQNASLEVFQDAGNNYTSSVQCRRFFTEEARNTKAWRRLAVDMGAGTLGSAAVGSATGATVSYTTPSDGAVADATDLNAGETTIIQASGQGPYLDVTITDSGASSTGWSAASVQAEAFDYGMRGR